MTVKSSVATDQANTLINQLPAKLAVRVFVLFALVYFLSTLARAITATLAPELTSQFALTAGNLGLLAGSYFVGFALMQLPLGYFLDRFGPPRTALAFLLMAVLGCAIFAMAQDFTGLLIGRLMLGLGLAAGLMAPLTAFRRWYSPTAQLRANSWMLMVGSLGMLMSTLPVQWLLPMWGWRGVFWLWAGLATVAFVGIWLWMPHWPFASQRKKPQAVVDQQPAELPATATASPSGFGIVLRDRRLLSMAPLGFVCYGGMFAILTLWAGPWMQVVTQKTPGQAAAGLFWINAVMLAVFFALGLLGPWLSHKAANLEKLALWLALPGLLVLPVVIWLGSSATWPWWALYCASVSGLSLLQPKLAQTFSPELAGRALTAFNLMTFAGTFFVQWGIGVAIDFFGAMDLGTVNTYRSAMLVFWACNIVAFGWFFHLRQKPEPARV